MSMAKMFVLYQIGGSQIVGLMDRHRMRASDLEEVGHTEGIVGYY